MYTLKSSKPVAKKQHKCDYCGLPIQIGEQYHLQTYIDGEYITTHTHLLCDKISEMMNGYFNLSEPIDEETFKSLVFEYLQEKLSDEEYNTCVKSSSFEDVMKHMYSIISSED